MFLVQLTTRTPLSSWPLPSCPGDSCIGLVSSPSSTSSFSVTSPKPRNNQARVSSLSFHEMQCFENHSSKASILQCSAFFIVQLSHPNMTTGKTIALTRWTFVGKVMSLLLNMLSRLIIVFPPRSKCLLISWLQSPSAVILEPPKICHCFHCFPIYLP